MDFSEHSATALRYGLELGRSFDARVEVFHAIEEAVYPDFYYPLLSTSLPAPEELRSRVEEELGSWVRKATGAGEEVRLAVGSGRAAAAIADRAREAESDLVVVASHGRTGLERVLLGSVAEDVIRRLPVPVLTVKSFGRSLLPEA